MAVRTYVQVHVCHDVDGQMTPLSIVFKGRHYAIDRVIGRPVHAPARRADGLGMRYTVRIQGQQTYLFCDMDRRWFVEERGPGDPPGAGQRPAQSR